MYQIPQFPIPNMAGVLSSAIASGANQMNALQASIANLGAGKRDLKQFAAKQMLVESMRKRAEAEEQARQAEVLAHRKEVTDAVQKDLKKILSDQRSLRTVRPIEYTDQYAHLWDPRDPQGSANKVEGLLMEGGRLSQMEAHELAQSLITERPVRVIEPDTAFEMVDRLVNDGQTPMGDAVKYLELATQGAYIGDKDLRLSMSKEVDTSFRNAFIPNTSSSSQTIVNMPGAEDALKSMSSMPGPGKLRVTEELLQAIEPYINQSLTKSQVNTLQYDAKGPQNNFLTRGPEGWSLTTGDGSPIPGERGMAVQRLQGSPYIQRLLDTYDSLGGQVTGSELKKETNRRIAADQSRGQADEEAAMRRAMYETGISAEDWKAKRAFGSIRDIIELLGGGSEESESEGGEESGPSLWKDPDDLLREGAAGYYFGRKEPPVPKRARPRMDPSYGSRRMREIQEIGRRGP